jgi:ubiquinone/menaquinone biosynthesis C-methylase UbiE
MREVYDESAAEYDRLPGHRDPAPPFKRLRAEFAALVRPQGAILDAGCGNGRDLPFFAEEGFAPTGLDLSPGMLALARGRFAGPLVEGDLRALPFAADTFAGVWACASVLHLLKADAPQALAEFTRVLEPAGQLGLAVKAGDGEAWEENRYGEGKRFFARYRPQELRDLVAGAGFDVFALREEQMPLTAWLVLLARAR